MRLQEIQTKEKPEPKAMGEMKMVDVYPYITADEKSNYLAKLEVSGNQTNTEWRRSDQISSV